MELSKTGRLRRNEQMARTAARAGSAPAAKTLASPLAQRRADQVSLSRQALNFLEEQNRRQMEETETSSEDATLEMLKKGQRELDNCLKIASRIRKGDKVPPEDEQYLMMHDPAGYRLAMASRKPKEHPKEWESVLTDEEKKELATGGVEKMASAFCNKSTPEL